MFLDMHPNAEALPAYSLFDGVLVFIHNHKQNHGSEINLSARIEQRTEFFCLIKRHFSYNRNTYFNTDDTMQDNLIIIFFFLMNSKFTGDMNNVAFFLFDRHVRNYITILFSVSTHLMYLKLRYYNTSDSWSRTFDFCNAKLSIFLRWIWDSFFSPKVTHQHYFQFLIEFWWWSRMCCHLKWASIIWKCLLIISTTAPPIPVIILTVRHVVDTFKVRTTLAFVDRMR